MPWWSWGRSEQARIFNVLIYEEDYKQLCAWVLKKPNIETGGDLFGLWSDKRTAVIQLVLGPGKDCRRTSVSFYQDVNYLERVGSYLTHNEGVCHIGEWHSHHQLGLAQPSGGDENTVWNNMPTYNLKRFVIFIANIQSSKQSYNVNIGCFLFETDEQGNRLDVLPGEFTILQKENPFSGKVAVEKKKGEEKDYENKIAIADLKLEVKAEGKSPSATYMKRFPPKKPKETRKFEVVIYEEDYKALCVWVLKKPDIETGGDLFGLWSDKRTAVIQLVLGPGQGCSRTSVSFYQDVNYLQRVGSYLTQNEGVCHIGEWHSHHQLGLAQPSGGDENTVWNNMPTYNLKRFVIFIANIQSSKQSYNVNIGCFLFEIDEKGNRLDVLPGEFTILQKENPFSGKVAEEKKKGAEKDYENNVAIADLELEVKAGRKSPSVTYVKRLPPRRPKEMRKFEVVIYEEDYKALCAWVLKKPDIETGGDLFGLWSDKRTAVIQLVLGPGKDCRRTTASFYQDIDYLQRVGSYLTRNEGVCHIGEWHSHHQMGLARPSGGDENTVWNNMPTYNLKKFVIFIATIQSSKQSYNVNIGCFLFEIDDHDHRLAVLPGEFTILQKKNLLALKQEVSMERSKDAEMDDESKVTIEDLKLEVKGGRNSQPSVKYLKPSPAPSNKRNREKKNQLQNENQDTNKADDEESCGDSKKQKMDTGASSPTTAGRSPGGGSSSPSGSLTNEGIQNLKIDDKQPDEQQELDMEVDEKEEQPEKKEEEEIIEDNYENSRAKDQNQDQARLKEISEAEKNKEKTVKIDRNREAGPSEGDQRKPENRNGDSISQPRPLPMLEQETTPTEQTGQKTLQVDDKAKTKNNQGKESATQEGRALPQLKKETTPTDEKAKTIDNQGKESATKKGRPLPQLKEQTTAAGQTGRQTQRVEATKANQSKGSVTQGARPLPQLGQETTPAGQTGRQGGAAGQTMQVKEKAKHKADMSKGSTPQGGRPPTQLAQGKTSAIAKTTVKPLKIEIKAVKRSGQQSSAKKAGSSGTGARKGKKTK